MNTEATATDEDYRLLASLMDFGSTSTSDPNWDWIPPSPRPIFFNTDAETHTDWSFSGVVGESSDIVTDDLNRPTSRKNMLAAEPKARMPKVRLTKMSYIVLFGALRSNAQFNNSAVSKMLAWSDWTSVNHRPPSFVHDMTALTGLQVQLMPKSTEKQREFQQVWQAYKVRIEYLRSEAELDGITVNEASERDFWSFFRSMPFLRKSGVILMDNGNLRAVWRGEHKSRLGLQFLGDQSVEFVIFKRRQAAKEVSRAAGFDTLNGFKKQIHAFDLKTLVYT